MRIDIMTGVMKQPIAFSDRRPLATPLAFAKILADDTRQQLMHACCCCWLSVTDLVDAMGGRVAQPTVSHHLAVLRDAGLIRLRKEGRQTFYTLDQGRMAVCCGELLMAFAPETAAAAALRQETAATAVASHPTEA